MKQLLAMAMVLLAGGSAFAGVKNTCTNNEGQTLTFFLDTDVAKMVTVHLQDETAAAEGIYFGNTQSGKYNMYPTAAGEQVSFALSTFQVPGGRCGRCDFNPDKYITHAKLQVGEKIYRFSCN